MSPCKSRANEVVRTPTTNDIVLFRSPATWTRKARHGTKIYEQWQVGLPDAFCKNTGHFDLSTVPDLSCVVFRKRHRENRETISIVQPQLLPVFGWLITFPCVSDENIAPRISSTAANKLRWKKCSEKIHY